MTKLAFDKDNNIIHIDKAMSKIDYFCADCGSRLRVKNGKVKSKHFFHVNADDCGGTGESLIHQYYKDVISKYKTIKLPIYDLDNKPQSLYFDHCPMSVQHRLSIYPPTI